MPRANANVIPPLSASDISRFWAKVRKRIGGCWEWTGMTCPAGYGWLSFGSRGHRRRYRAHRLSWMIHHGQPDSAMFICHHCDNPKCVKPSHLFQGTCADNIADRGSKGRTASGDRHGFRMHPERAARGERCWNAVLNESIVRYIRQTYVKGSRGPDGFGSVALGRRLGVASTLIRKVIHREIWKHIMDVPVSSSTTPPHLLDNSD